MTQFGIWRSAQYVRFEIKHKGDSDVWRFWRNPLARTR